MLLGFKPQFVQPILDGTKIHTIRTDEHNRWKRDRLIHMATGVRTKNYNCFKETTCISTQRILMTYAYSNIIEISIGATYLFGFHERVEFAKNDGFKDWDEFFDWFYPIIKKSHNEVFTGKVIHWTDKRY